MLTVGSLIYVLSTPGAKGLASIFRVPIALPLMKKNKSQAWKETNDQAWVGDAVLSLYARQWVLRQEATGEGLGESRDEAFRWFTCNDFLATIGQPTEVEAAIGIVYLEQGEQAAFDFIEGKILPRYLKQRANRLRL